MPPEPPPTDKLSRAITAQEKALERTISLRRQGAREMTPEHLRVLGVVHELLGELRRLRLARRAARRPDDAALQHSLEELVAGHDVDSLSIQAAWEYALCLQRLLLLVGDRHYIRAQLESEWRIEVAPEPYVFGKWGRFFERQVLRDLLDAFGKPGGVTEGDETHRQAVEYLTHLSLTRNGKGRSLAMNDNTRRLYLDQLTKVLAGLVLLVLFLIYLFSHGAHFASLEVLRDAFGGGGWASLGQLRPNFGGPDFRHAFVAAALGALGGLLSGFYTLRDKAKYLNDLRSFRAAMWAQPFVGAAAGMLVFIIVRSGIVGLTVRDDVEPWPAFAVYGFLAGFSEPFFLGIVSRVANSADRDKDKDREDEAAETREDSPPRDGRDRRRAGSPNAGGSPDAEGSPWPASPFTSPDDEGVVSPDDEDADTSPASPPTSPPTGATVVTSPPGAGVVRSPDLSGGEEDAEEDAEEGGAGSPP